MINNAIHSTTSSSIYPKMVISYLWGGEAKGEEGKDAKYLAVVME